MHEESARPDVAVAKIAARQHGVVSFAQLNWAGLDKDAIARRIAGGRLHRVHRGVYAVGHKGLSNEGTWMAAVLACGEGAALSHRSAAELWRMLPPAGGVPNVTVPTYAGRRRRARRRPERNYGPTIGCSVVTGWMRTAMMRFSRTDSTRSS